MISYCIHFIFFHFIINHDQQTAKILPSVPILSSFSFETRALQVLVCINLHMYNSDLQHKNREILNKM